MEISITKEIFRFYSFLNKKGNDRIVFSGKFGIGKTYFMKYFFDENHSDENYSKKFLPIYLSPVNYSVASNEDIFEYIKLNVLFELLHKTSCELTTSNIHFSIGAYYYLKSNRIDIIANIFSRLEKLSLKTDFIEHLITLKKNIDTYIENSHIDEKKDVEKFISDISNKKGSLYENDIITQIIKTFIKSYKENNKNKQIILVIDDLDRIDPEHIFRIMNVLSAHDDFCDEGEHKLGFDKTILICDIENIKNIYHGHHGMDVDFNGYIDKFYSKEVFQFDNIGSIKKTIYEIISNIKMAGTEITSIYDSDWNDLLVHTINSLLEKGALNLRTLLKVNGKNIDGNRDIQFPGYNKIINSNSPAILYFDILKLLYPDKNELLNSINKIDFKDCNKSSYIYSIFIILAGFNISFFEEKQHSYRGQIFTKNPKYFMGEIQKNGTLKENDEIINGNDLIKDACKNYIKYFYNRK